MTMIPWLRYHDPDTTTPFFGNTNHFYFPNHKVVLQMVALKLETSNCLEVSLSLLLWPSKTQALQYQSSSRLWKAIIAIAVASSFAAAFYCSLLRFFLLNFVFASHFSCHSCFTHSYFEFVCFTVHFHFRFIVSLPASWFILTCLFYYIFDSSNLFLHSFSRALLFLNVYLIVLSALLKAGFKTPHVRSSVVL